jgi:flagellar motility protein MotE (MotC chaperone)
MKATVDQRSPLRGAPRGRAGERGAAGPLGLLAVFVATAIVLTVVLLFVTGVAQQGILPRIRARALRVAQPEVADSTASQAAETAGHAAADHPAAAGAGAPSEHAPAVGSGAVGEGAPGAGAGLAGDQAGADSLRTLREQIRVGRQALDERIAAVQEESALAAQQRAQADEESERRLRTLAKVYSSMKPEAAARVMASLDDTTFARVLQKLDKRQAAKVLALIDPERVARLTQEAANTTVADRGGN